MKYGFLFIVGSLMLAGCGQEEIQTYQAPKEIKPIPTVQPLEEQPAEPGFTATLPKGWTEQEASGMRTASYTIEGTDIDFYLTPLMIGDVPSNVNRWRGQVGLPPESPETISEEVEMFQVDGHETHYIEIFNAENDHGIVAAIVDLAPQYWYFTAKGPAAELKSHIPEIRTFLESLKIGQEQ